MILEKKDMVKIKTVVIILKLLTNFIVHRKRVCPLRRGRVVGAGLLNGQNPLSVTKVIC